MRADDGGTVTIKRSTYRKLHDDRRIAEYRARLQTEHEQHVRAWAHEAFEEQRRLADRLTFVYGVARAHGATVEELSGP